jgi:hypothetical protein
MTQKNKFRISMVLSVAAVAALGLVSLRYNLGKFESSKPLGSINVKKYSGDLNALRNDTASSINAVSDMLRQAQRQ